MLDFIQKINPQAGIVPLSGTGSPENNIVAYVGSHYLDNANADLYYKFSGDNTNTGWTLINGSGGGSTPIIDNLTSTSTTSALSANQGRVLNNAKEPVFSKNNAFNKNFGTTSGTVMQGNDARVLVKRRKVLIGTSLSSNKKGVSFSYGTTIQNPFFELAMTSGNNNDAFVVKVTNVTTTSAYLEVYRADGSNWGDSTVSCYVTIYSGTY